MSYARSFAGTPRERELVEESEDCILKNHSVCIIDEERIDDDVEDKMVGYVYSTASSLLERLLSKAKVRNEVRGGEVEGEN